MTTRAQPEALAWLLAKELLAEVARHPCESPFGCNLQGGDARFDCLFCRVRIFLRDLAAGAVMRDPPAPENPTT